MLYLNLNFFDRFTPTVLTLILAFYLVSRRQAAARYLGIFFAFLTVFNAGYLLGYSGWHPFATYGFHLACFITFALVFKIQFAYRMPQLIFRKESFVVFLITIVVSAAAVADYSVKALQAGDRFVFDQHIFASRHASSYVPLASTIMFLWVAVVLLRQMARLTGELQTPAGQNRFARIFRPARLFMALFRGDTPETRAVRGFLLLVFVELAINIIVLLGFLTSFVPKKLMNQILNTGLLFVYFAYGILYVNHSRQSTTMMLRLVGISLVTLLVVTGLLGARSLQRLDASLDFAYLSRLPSFQKAVTQGEVSDLPEDVLYVAVREPGGLYSAKYSLIGGRQNTTAEALAQADAEDREFQIRTRSIQLKRERGVDMRQAGELATSEVDAPAAITGIRRFRSINGQPYMHYDLAVDGKVYEFGFAYSAYRAPIHDAVLENVAIVLIVTLAIMLVFPLFFRVNLVTPLTLLLTGVDRVNKGDLNTHVAVQVEDEIGFLARAFNAMVASVRTAQQKLREYAETLEQRVRERTQQLQSAFDNLDALKRKQDGDYFLTSLLIAPLSHNNVQAANVSVQFLTRQKKQFEFKHWKAEIGGDICIGDQITLQGKQFTVVINADAMGKSIQGSGGVLVLGSLFQAILNRTRAGLISDYTPERWIQQGFREMDLVFKSFKASMLVSVSLVLLDESTGLAYYISAEHPLPVLLRSGEATFLEYPHALNKLGTPDGASAPKIETFMLRPNDILILASDGRDDILIPSPEGDIMNEEPGLFLDIVRGSRGDPAAMEQMLAALGELTDDLSIARISIAGIEDHPPRAALRSALRESVGENNWEHASALVDELLRHYPEDTDFLPTAGRVFKKAGKIHRAIDVLESARMRRASAEPLLIYDLAKLYFKSGKQARALQLIDEFLTLRPADPRALEIQRRILSIKDRDSP